MEYVTENFSPPKVWKAKALPTNGMLPEGTGVPLSGFTRVIATSPPPNGAFKGSPNSADA